MLEKEFSGIGWGRDLILLSMLTQKKYEPDSELRTDILFPKETATLAPSGECSNSPPTFSIFGRSRTTHNLINLVIYVYLIL